ncbi:hypothetical protein DAPPUDRAFT_262340 [Daphnia pulex]|uniref:Uncharacterized protein n=1 Tax=Daphnia pulex TaxID=6669 RepID=E9HMT6_DAPPU|nr:hypothetical protein DAPPUDRAFT_262340 [Daphnia pulex]|eukprot:EFX66919.1 hypothetical protein DAPPUDRAFT_262340 [Daphnia pulex]
MSFISVAEALVLRPQSNLHFCAAKTFVALQAERTTTDAESLELASSLAKARPSENKTLLETTPTTTVPFSSGQTPVSTTATKRREFSWSANSSTQWHCKVDSSFEKRLYHKKTSGQNHQFDYLYGIRDHNAVKLLEADWALMDFQAYVNETVAGNSPNCGGLAMVSTREGYAGFTKFDDFSTVAVTPLRQPYRWCRESVLSAMGTAKEVGRRGLTVAVGQLSVESLTEVDYGLKMRDLLKEIVQLRLAFDNDGCLEMLKTSSMTSLQERERSRVLEVVLHETGESSVRKVVDWQCEAANVSYVDSDAETVLATDCREELEPATSAVAQTRTNGAEWHRWAENVPHVDSEAETVPDTG